MTLRKKPVVAAENFRGEKNLSAVHILKMSKDKDEQLKQAHKVFDVVDRVNRKTCMTLLRYKLDKPKSSCARVRIFESKKEDGKFHEVF